MTQSDPFGSGDFERLFRQWLALSLSQCGHGSIDALFPQSNVITDHAMHAAALEDASRPALLYLRLHQLADRDPALASQLITYWFKALLDAKVLSARDPFTPRSKGGRPRKKVSATKSKPPGRPRDVTPESDRELLELIDGVKGIEKEPSGSVIHTDRAAVTWLLANALPSTHGDLNPVKRNQLAKTLANRASRARRSRKSSGNS